MFSEKVEIACQEITTIEDFSNIIEKTTSDATKSLRMQISRIAVDEEYERLRAIRRRAERRARKTKNREDIRKSRQAQRKVQRHLDKLSMKRWRSNSARLDPRKPVTQIWHMTRSLGSRPQQTYPFRSIALHRQVTQKEVAKDYCLQITRDSSISYLAIPIASHNTASVQNDVIDAPFTLI